MGALANLGLFLCPAGQLARAEEVLLRAVALGERAHPTSGEFGQALHNLALMYRNNERWAEAERSYARAIEVLHGVDGPAITVTLRDAGLMWAQRADTERARACYHEAERQVRRRLRPEAAAAVLQQLQTDLDALGRPAAITSAVSPATPGGPPAAGSGAAAPSQTFGMRR